MNNHSTHTPARAPVQVWTGGLVFLLPLLMLVTVFGVGLISFLFLISALVLFKPSRDALRRDWPRIRWVVLAFLLQTLFVLACMLMRGSSMSMLEKPARMLLATSALALVLAVRAPRRAFWWGAVGDALAALPFVAWQRIGLHIERPGGFINAIAYGDLTLLLALVSLAGAIDMRASPRRAWLAGAGALAGLAASVLTGTRGCWPALLLVVLVLGWRVGLPAARRARVLLCAGVLLLASVWLVPGLGMQQRFVQGVRDVETWYQGGSVWTNVGTRLELWRGALMLIRERPLLGRDMSAAYARLAEYGREGRLDPAVLTLPHLHNDVLQVLVSGGVLGLVLWAATLGAPLAFFLRQLGRDVQAPEFAVALAGALVVLCYIGFGLTEVIFWSSKACLFYALMVFTLMGLCLNAKEKIG